MENFAAVKVGDLVMVRRYDFTLGKHIGGVFYTTCTGFGDGCMLAEWFGRSVKYLPVEVLRVILPHTKTNLDMIFKFYIGERVYINTAVTSDDFWEVKERKIEESEDGVFTLWYRLGRGPHRRVWSKSSEVYASLAEVHRD